MGLFQDMISPMIDPIQLEIDKQHCSSEVHLLLKNS